MTETTAAYVMRADHIRHCQAQMDDAGVRIYLRPREILFRVINPAAGPCESCGELLALVWCCWDHRISSGPMYMQPWKLGEDHFPSYRHADGKVPCAGFGASDYLAPQCGGCGSWNTLTRRQEAYGDRIDCKTCGWSKFYDIGD